MASTKLIALSVDMAMQLLRARERARLRKIESGLDLCLDLCVDPRSRGRFHPIAERLDRVARFPARRLLTLAEAEREILARPHMLEPSIGHALDECRAGAVSRRTDGFLRRCIQREH